MVPYHACKHSSSGDVFVIIYKAYSPQETFELGRKLAQNAFPGQIITLDGELGCGKTVFTKGFAEGLGINDAVTSPTFTIVQEYDSGRLALYHFDVYRIDDPDEMLEIGFDDYLFGNGVCIIEWAQRIKELLPENVVRITIKKDGSEDFDNRIIEVCAPEEVTVG